MATPPKDFDALFVLILGGKKQLGSYFFPSYNPGPGVFGSGFDDEYILNNKDSSRVYYPMTCGDALLYGKWLLLYRFGKKTWVNNKLLEKPSGLAPLKRIHFISFLDIVREYVIKIIHM